MPLSISSRGALQTHAGSVHIETGGTGRYDLVAITPIGAEGLHATLPAELGELFTVHVVELPGTGRSAGDPARQSVATVVGAVKEVGSAIASDKFVVFGHSMNGTLALAAGADPSCAGVIAVGAPPRLPPDAEAVRTYWEAKAEPRRRRLSAELIAAYNDSDDYDEKSALRERHDRLRRWYDLEFDPTEFDSLAQMDLGWVQAVFESAESVDWPATVRSVTCPVLLALGEYDFVVPMSGWAEDLRPPLTTTTVFDRSGHTPFLEQPSDFVHAVDLWLSDLVA